MTIQTTSLSLLLILIMNKIILYH